MAVFRVVSRESSLVAGAPSRQSSFARKLRRRLLRFTLPTLIGGALIALLSIVFGRLGLTFLFFLLLPVYATLIAAFRRLATSTFRSIVFSGCLAFVYFSALASFELLTHKPSTPEYIVVTTTLASAVLFEPLRTYAQDFFEQRFHLRNDAARKAIEAYTSTLREEIDLDKVRDGMLAAVQRAFHPRSLALWIHTQPGDTSAEAEAGNETASIADNDPFLSYALNHTSTLALDRLKLESPFIKGLRQAGVDIVLPLASQGELLGLTLLGLRLDGEEYDREDRALLTTLGAQVAPSLRVAQLALAQQRQAQERERIEQELRTAQVIQRTFLPKEIPTLDGWRLTPYYQPAREVGGDFYDVFTLKDGRLGLAIGDVTGKGIPAALVMTAARTMLRTAAQDVTSPGEALARVNNVLGDDIPPGTFVTCFYAVLEPTSGRLCYANAGQELPLLRRRTGDVTEVHATGMPLGLLPDVRYDEDAMTLEAGDNVLLYSDGLTEAHNPAREMFGVPRMMDVARECSANEALERHLLDALTAFTGSLWEQEDDITLVALQRLG